MRCNGSCSAEIVHELFFRNCRPGSSPCREVAHFRKIITVNSANLALLSLGIAVMRSILFPLCFQLNDNDNENSIGKDNGNVDNEYANTRNTVIGILDDMVLLKGTEKELSS